MLSVKNISVFYGQLQALWDVSIKVEEKDFLTVLGSNGAGKTTLLRAISGLCQPLGGSVKYRGQRIDGLPPHRITELGIVQIPQGRKIFPAMRIIEHLEMGAYLPGPRRNFKQNAQLIFDTYPILRERRNQMAGTLSGGEQQMLAVGRGLMSQPELLMLDEPTLGLAPKLALQMLSSLKQLSARGIALLLVSQETLQCLKLARRAYVLENGRVALQGMASEVLNNEAIKKSYLGL